MAFNVNFGGSKEPEPLELPDEGNYVMVITNYEVVQAQKEESRERGFNVKLTLKMDEGQNADPRIKVFHNLWVDFENPWAAEIFFKAVTEKDELDPSFAEKVEDEDLWPGEKVGVFLVKESYKDKRGEKRWKMAPADAKSFFPASSVD